MSIKIPEDFARRVEGAFGKRGQVFLHALPTLIGEATTRWQLKGVRPAQELSYNFIAYARRGETEVVLKLGVPDRELTSEIHALRAFAGRGAVRLIDGDSGRGMLLLERIKPGTNLASISNDAEATQIAAYVMLALLRPAPVDGGLLQLGDWFHGFQRFRARHGGSGPLDPALFQQAEEAAQELLEEDHRPTLIHGDLHHFNILSSGGSWVAIDPKGVIGPAAYEVGPFLLNPIGELNRRPDAAEVIRNRVVIFGEILGINVERIRRCGMVHAVLSAIWSMEEGGNWKAAMEVAGVLAGLKV
ncbi:MAG TPA: aminoglycoside phosphotransferase family protein [Anaerolineales bacterium]|nr:aminoglycoside phosphotransferase family protein [Anaerolineales bacterium]